MVVCVTVVIVLLGFTQNSMVKVLAKPATLLPLLPPNWVPSKLPTSLPGAKPLTCIPTVPPEQKVVAVVAAILGAGIIGLLTVIDEVEVQPPEVTLK